MQLRTQTTLMICAALLCGAGIAVTAGHAIDVSARAAAAGTDARQALREARALLLLTHEMSHYSHERVARQWRARERRMAEALARARQVGLADVEPPNIEAELAALPATFDILVETFDSDSEGRPLHQRQELLTDLLISEAQTVADEVYQWDERIEQRRNEAERRLALLVVLGPLVLSVPLVALGWMVLRRVLGPVGRLQSMMARVEAGDLSVRNRSTRPDEVGDLMRAFTRMTEALESSTSRLAENERRLRLITDNLPARVSHYDRNERCTFANRHFWETWGYSGPEQVIGRSCAELLPEPLFAATRPHVEAVCAGRSAFFTVSLQVQGRRRHHEFAMVPDTDAQGRVQGLYAMARDVTERVESEARIEAALREKEVLLREVHHRVKNNLQIVSSLLRLQANTEPGSAVRELLDDSRGRIRSMALIHEKLYQHDDFAKIDFADYLRGLLAVLSASHGSPARVDVDAESLWLGIDQAVPAGLIVNELVTNSWKHAFPDGRGGSIRVRLAAEGSRHVRLEVADDGVGLGADVDPWRGSSLGLRLVRLLAEQLDAELRFSGPPGFGCSVAFERATIEGEEAHG